MIRLKKTLKELIIFSLTLLLLVIGSSLINSYVPCSP